MLPPFLTQSSRRAFIIGGSALAIFGDGSAARSQEKLTSRALERSSLQDTLINVTHFGAVGDGVTNDAFAIQSAIDACNPNRGGTVFFPQGTYRIGSGLVVRHQGTQLLGEGMPGVSEFQALGSTRIVSDAGVTAITAYSGAHGTLGYGFSRLHVMAAKGAGRGNEILIKDTESCIFEDLTVSDYTGGVGLTIDGLGGNAQYHTLRNFSAGDCLTGIKTQGSAPNGLRIQGGYFAGLGTSPRSGSIAISLTSGDTSRLFGVVIQGYETGYSLVSPAAGHEIYGIRTEYCNTCIRIGGAVRRFRMAGGVCDNSILANGKSAGNIGIQIGKGAREIMLDPTYITGVITAISDSSEGGVRYPMYGPTPSSKVGLAP